MFNAEDHKTYWVLDFGDETLRVTEDTYNRILELLKENPNSKQLVECEMLWGAMCYYRLSAITGVYINTPEDREAHISHNVVINKETEEFEKKYAPKEWE